MPVLAAGGIGTGRAMAAALAAGADGVRVGTRFVAATEAAAHPEYVAALIASQAEDTIYTTAFSRSWPDAPHRILRSCITAAEAFQGDTVGEITALDGTNAGAEQGPDSRGLGRRMNFIQVPRGRRLGHEVAYAVIKRTLDHPIRAGGFRPTFVVERRPFAKNGRRIEINVRFGIVQPQNAFPRALRFHVNMRGWPIVPWIA